MLLSKSSEQKRETLSVLPILPKEFTSLVSFFLPVSTKLCVCAKSLQSRPTLVTLCTTGPRLLCTRDSPGKNTGVGCHSLLQGIFPIQEQNSSLTSPALADGFFCFFFFLITSTTLEALYKAVQLNILSQPFFKTLGFCLVLKGPILLVLV